MQLNSVQLMPIGRFSRLTGVGVKALRHYDEVGLLVPAAVDDETGYRFYSADQVDRAEAIRLLRRLDMPLEEIRSTLAAGDPADASRRARLAPAADGDSRRRASRVQGEAAAAHRRKGDDHGNALGVTRGRGAPPARHRPVQPHLDADGLARRRDAPLRARVRLPLDAGGRDDGEPRAQRVAVLARLLDPRPARARAPSRAPLHRARRVVAGGDGGLGHRRARTRRSRAPISSPARRRRHAATTSSRARTIAQIANPEDRKHIEADLDALAPLSRLGAVRGEW